MNDLNLQKKKTVLLASAIACFQAPGLLITQHLHNSRYLPAFVIGWVLFMTALLGFAIFQLMILTKMKRSQGA